jgi:hypothetical protein
MVGRPRSTACAVFPQDGRVTQMMAKVKPKHVSQSPLVLSLREVHGGGCAGPMEVDQAPNNQENLRLPSPIQQLEV